MEIQFREGLLFTSMEISFKGATKTVDNIVIDTGAVETIISPDTVEDLGIIVEFNDSVNSYYGVGGTLHNFFSKKVNDVTINSAKLTDVKLDFGVIDPGGSINGLLGLDLLMKLGANIDLKRLTLVVQSK